MLAMSMTGHRTLPTAEFTKYGLPAEELSRLDATLTGFAKAIRQHKIRRGQSIESVDLTGPGNTGSGPDLV